MLPNPYSMGFRPDPQTSRFHGFDQNGAGLRDSMDDVPIGPESGLAVPVVLSFNSIIGTAWRTYWHGRYDEALRHSQENADAMMNDPFVMRIINERKLAVQSLGARVEVDNERDPWQKAIKDGLTQLYRAIPCGTDLRWYLLQSLFVGRYASQMGWAYKNLKLPALPRGGAGMMAAPGRGETQRMRAMTMGIHRPYHGDKIGYNFDGTPYMLVSYLAAVEAEKQGADIRDPYQADSARNWYPPLKATGADMGYTTTGGRALFLKSPSWRQRFCIHRHEVLDQEFWNPERADIVHGIGIRSTIYWYWWLRQEFLSNVTDWCARTGLGVRLWYFQAGNSQSYQQVNRAAKEQSDKVNILIPRTEGGSEEVSFVDTSGTGAELLLKIVKHLEEHIELYVLGQSMSKGRDDGGNELGGTGRANFARSTKFQITKYDAEKLGDTITEDILKVFLRWTYGPEFADLPVRLVYNVDNPDPKEYLDAAKTFVEMGGTVREANAREVLGFDEPHEGDKLLGGQQQTGQPIVGPDAAHHPGNPAEGGPTTAPNAQPPAVPVNGQPEAQPANGQPVQRFQQKPPLRYGAWYTIGGHAEGGKKHVGGSHVYIENGQITKGHPRLVGRAFGKQGRLGYGAEAGAIPEDVAKEAKQSGIRDEDLNGLAKQFMEHDQEFKRDEHGLLQEVRKYHPEYQQRARQLAQQGNTWTARDASGHGVLPDFDQHAAALANRSEYRHLFQGKEDEAGYLFDLLARGNPQPMTNEEAYQQALDYLVQAKEQGQYEPEYEGTDFPFGANAPAEGEPAAATTAPEPQPAKANAQQTEQANQIANQFYKTAIGAATKVAGGKGDIDEIHSAAGAKLEELIRRKMEEEPAFMQEVLRDPGGASAKIFGSLVSESVGNAVRDLWRRQGAKKRGGGRVESLGEIDPAARPESTVEDEEEKQRQRQALAEGVKKLPPRQQRLILARQADENMNLVVQELGLTPEQGRKQLHLAIKALKRDLTGAQYELALEVLRYREVGPDRYEETDVPQRYDVQAPIRDEVWHEILEQSKTYGPRAGEFIRAVMEAMRDSPSQWDAIVKGRQAFLSRGAARFQREQAEMAVRDALRFRLDAVDAIREVLRRTA